METILAFLIALVILVVIHELGHFFVAKLFSVRVDEFGVGYPPRAKKLFTWKGTLFTLNWLPFGGFVKIFGEDVPEGGTISEEDRKHSFLYKPFWQRALIVIAGVFSNVILAMVLYTASFAIGFLGSQSDYAHSVALGPQQVLISAVVPGSPAQGAGLQSGDAVVSIQGGTDTVSPTTAAELTDFVHTHGTVPLDITVIRNKTDRTFVATPRAGLSDGKPGIGIDITEATQMRLPFFEALKEGVAYALYEFKAILISLGMLVGGLFGAGKNIISDVSGPVGIAKIAGTALSFGFGSFLSFMALISVNLAVVNLLPFPALDGGRLVLECFASKGKSRIPRKVVNGINQAGFLLLIALMPYVTYLDVARLIA